MQIGQLSFISNDLVTTKFWELLCFVWGLCMAAALVAAIIPGLLKCSGFELLRACFPANFG